MRKETVLKADSENMKVVHHVDLLVNEKGNLIRDLGPICNQRPRDRMYNVGIKQYASDPDMHMCSNCLGKLRSIVRKQSNA